MNYTEGLNSKGYLIEFEKGASDDQGYDLFLRLKLGESYSESFFHLVILLVITSHGIMERIVVERVVNGKLMMKNWFVNT